MNELKNWQKDETQLETEKVQVWGETMIGKIALNDAKQMVKNGTHFVITSQAIGVMESR